jgi:hypothetical protein
MGERTRQECHWWISLARQELSLDRERCANEIVIGKHLESCANPIEGWIAYRRLTSTCAYAYYHDRVDVKCVTEPGEAIWDTIATDLRAMLGISYRNCLEARTREMNKTAWYRMLLESYALEGCMEPRVLKYYQDFSNVKADVARDRYWRRKYVVNVDTPVTRMTSSIDREVVFRDLPREYQAKFQRHRLWKREVRGMIYANKYLEKVLPRATGQCEALRTAGKGWKDEPARQQKLRAWEEIEKILKYGLEEVNWGSATIWTDYLEVKHELDDEGSDRSFVFVPLKKQEQDQAGGSHC